MEITDNAKKKLKLNRQKFVEDILNNDFDCNQAACARELGITAGYLCAFLSNETKNVGSVLGAGIMNYCKKTGKNYQDFIIVESDFV